MSDMDEVNDFLKDDDDSDPAYQRYNCDDVAVEPYPASINFRPELFRLQESLDEIVGALDIGASSDDMVEAQAELKAEIDKYRQTSSSQNFQVGVYGSMASGKSSAVNSLLSQGTIARKGDSGESCTWVVQSYVQKFPEQSATFAAKVYFLSPAQIKEIFSDLLQKYYRIRHDVVKQEMDDMTKGENEADLQEIVGVFRSLFCEYMEFATDQFARDYLDAIDSEDATDKLEEMQRWASAIMDKYSHGQNFVFYEHEEPEALTRSIQVFTHRSQEHAANNIADPWLLVHHIDIGVDTKIGRSGITLIDAPGLSDANRYRRQRGLEIMRTASHIMIVARISRAISDMDLQEQLEIAAKHHDTSNIIVVLTHADSVDDDVECFGTDAQNRTLKAIEDELRTVTKAIKNNRNKLHHPGQAPGQSVHELSREIEELKSRKQKFKARWKSVRLEIRNSNVVRDVKAKYSAVTSVQADLKVFPVGNSAYAEHQQGYTPENTPKVAVEATGVPTLRRYLLALPARYMLSKITTTVNTILPQLLDTFVLHMNKVHIPNVCTAIEVVDTQDSEIWSILDHVTQRAREAFITAVTKPMREAAPSWSSRANTVVKRWKSFHDQVSGEHLMMIRNDGFRLYKRKRKHGRPTVVNWNADLLQLGNTVLTPAFVNYSSELSRTLQDASGTFTAPLSEMLHKVRTDVGSYAQPGTLDSFIDSLAREIAGVRSSVRETDRQLQTDLRTIRNRGTTFIDDAYVVQRLRRACNSASSLLYGRNVALRQELLEEELSDNGILWFRMLDEIDRDCAAAVEKAIRELTTSFTAGLARIKQRCDTVVERARQSEQRDSGGSALGNDLSATIAASKDRMSGLQLNLKACERFQEEYEKSSL